MTKEYRSKCARDARDSNYGDANYWQYLDLSAISHSEYFERRGDTVRAKEMLTQSLEEALQGNDGD